VPLFVGLGGGDALVDIGLMSGDALGQLLTLWAWFNP
jgi:hypothetical protein